MNGWTITSVALIIALVVVIGIQAGKRFPKSQQPSRIQTKYKAYRDSVENVLQDYRDTIAVQKIGIELNKAYWRSMNVSQIPEWEDLPDSIKVKYTPK